MGLSGPHSLHIIYKQPSNSVGGSQCCIHFYADDTQIYIRIDSIKDIKGKLSSLINDIKIWMNGRKLKLNDGKTEIIIVKGNLRSNVVEEFGGLELPCALQFLLGIWASYLIPC